MTLVRRTLLLHELETTFAIIIVQDDEERLKISGMLAGNNLVDPDQMIVTEGSRKH